MRGAVPERVRGSVPRLVLVGLVVAVAATVGYAAATSTADFGVANPAWDGASQVGDVAESQGLARTLVDDASGYDDVGAGTLAVVLAPAETYSRADVERIRAFLERGGSLLVASDFRPGANDLLASLGASASVTGLPLRDERRYGAGPAFPRATAVADHPLTEGVRSLALNHPSAVDPGGATVLVRSSPYAYQDANGNGDLDDEETIRRHPVATVESLGTGQVVVLGDPSAFINVMLERGDNAAFLRALLAGHDRVLLDVSHSAGLPPLATVQLRLEDSPLGQLVVGIAGILAVVGLVGSGRRVLARLAPVADHRFGRLIGLASRTDEPRDPPVDRSPTDVARTVRRRHPDWEEDRIERVTEGIIRRRGIGRGDD